ncbi:MAG: hypothetical protein JRH20_17810, partial [Deltaproteobacteria bacterium]|nr:hypothetical protein [Deltaproteobacteria bacterium]
MIKNLMIGVGALGALLWVSAAEARFIRSAADCQSRIGNFNKRARCMACVNRGGIFKKQGHKRPGLCKHSRPAARPAPPPPPRRPPVTVAPPHRRRGVHGSAIVRSVSACLGGISRPGKRDRCRRCIRSGGLFHRRSGRGHGFCRFPSTRTWRPKHTLRTLHQCNRRIRRPNKRARCVSCVNNGGIYQKRGFGFCRGGAVAPPPPPPAPANRTIYSPSDCRRFIARPGKRSRCGSCTVARGQFVTQGRGRGFCRRAAAPPPPPPGKVHSIVDCKHHIVRPGKRSRCVNCVTRGGVFLKQGAMAGFCRGARDVNTTVHSPTDCQRFISKPGKRGRCVSCTSGRGRFVTQGPGRGFCRRATTPPPPPPRRRDTLRSVPECQARVRNISKRKRCVHCVRSGGAFHKQGVGTGTCSGARRRVPAATPNLGRAIRTPQDCKTRIARPHKKGRCLACVRGRRTFYRQGGGTGV